MPCAACSHRTPLDQKTKLRDELQVLLLIFGDAVELTYPDILSALSLKFLIDSDDKTGENAVKVAASFIEQER